MKYYKLHQVTEIQLRQITNVYTNRDMLLSSCNNQTSFTFNQDHLFKIR